MASRERDRESIEWFKRWYSEAGHWVYDSREKALETWLTRGIEGLPKAPEEARSALEEWAHGPVPAGKARCSVCGKVGSKGKLHEHEKACKSGDCGRRKLGAETTIRDLAKRDHNEDVPLPSSEMEAAELLSIGAGLSSDEQDAVRALGAQRAGRLYVEALNALTGHDRRPNEGQGSLFDPPRRGGITRSSEEPSLKSRDSGPAPATGEAGEWSPMGNDSFAFLRLDGTNLSVRQNRHAGTWSWNVVTQSGRVLGRGETRSKKTSQQAARDAADAGTPSAAPAPRTYNPDIHRKGDPTDINMYVLSEYFGPNERIPNQMEATAAPHLRRCLKAGLLVPEGKELVLTPAGVEALATWRHRNRDWREGWERNQEQLRRRR